MTTCHRHWSFVVYQLDSILPRNVCSGECMEQQLQQVHDASIEKHQAQLQVLDSCRNHMDRREHPYDSLSTITTAGTTSHAAYRYFPMVEDSYDERKPGFVVDWKQRMDDKDSMEWYTHERVCNRCQMFICSNCGNPFSDEEYSNGGGGGDGSPVYNDHLAPSFDGELQPQDWRRWPLEDDDCYDVAIKEWRSNADKVRNPSAPSKQAPPAPKKKKSRSAPESMLTKAELSRYFDLPRKEAAKRLGVCVTLLKRRCRELGIHCWPFRKMRCLDDRIRHLENRKEQQVCHSSDELVVDKQIRTLQQRRAALLKNPNISLQQLLMEEDEI